MLSGIVIALIVILGAAVLFLLGFALYHNGTTARPRDAAGKPLTGGIASLEEVKIGGVDQWLLMRGEKRSNPVLLFLHGGPGFSEMVLSRYFGAELEKHFVVVNWDQRGAGKSYARGIPADSMTVERFVADTIEVTELLKERFQREKIYLVGHSWGSYLGVRAVAAYPESYYAYVGTGQVAEMPAGERAGYDYALGRAEETHNQAALEELGRIGPPDPVTGSYSEKRGVYTERKWLNKFGCFLHEPDKAKQFFPILLGAREYSLRDLLGIVFNNPRLSCPDSLMAELMRVNLVRDVPEVRVPVYFFLGRHDWWIPATVAAGYFDHLRAPKKELVWFEQSAHSPCFEEPEKFNRLMVEKVLAETYEG